MNIADWFNMAGSHYFFFSSFWEREKAWKTDNNKELRESKESFIIF